jgi:hypothetical protein
VGILALLALATPTVQAQTAFGGSFADFDGDSNYGATDELRDTENDAANDALDSGVEMSQWGLDTYESANEFLENYQALGNTDNLCDIGNSGPRIPSSCGEEGSECHECFRSATDSLNFNRRNLHRAWCITHTNLAMAKSAIGFGDSASGVHGVAGLSWSLGGKPQIESAMSDLRKTYRRKYGDFVRSIDTNLKALGRCEAKHFDERDWYDRFGFMYLEHLKVRYESPEP